MQKHKFSADELSAILNQESGIKGISGLSGDMRQLIEAMDSGNERASLAFDIYIHSLTAHIGSLTTYIGGLDALVFTGGIGENSARVRSAACERLAFLNLAIDKSKNERFKSGAGETAKISAAKSLIQTYVIAAGEEVAIAAECRKLNTSSSRGTWR